MRTLRRAVVVLTALSAFGAAAGYAATLPVGSVHLWDGTQALTKGTCTLTGTAQTADTFVQQDKAATASGGTATMNVQSATGKAHWAFVTFDLSSCNLPATGGADTATLSLRLTTKPAQSRTLTLTPVTAPWASSLTWNGAQSLTYGAATTTFATGTTANVTLSIPVTVDVDARIKDATASYGWRIDDEGAISGTQTSTFASSQAASNKPTLTIDYEK